MVASDFARHDEAYAICFQDEEGPVVCDWVSAVPLVLLPGLRTHLRFRFIVIFQELKHVRISGKVGLSQFTREAVTRYKDLPPIQRRTSGVRGVIHLEPNVCCFDAKMC